MPVLDLSELNIVITIFGMFVIPVINHRTHLRIGAFIVLYGVVSVKMKQVWLLGEACEFRTRACIQDDQD